MKLSLELLVDEIDFLEFPQITNQEKATSLFLEHFAFFDPEEELNPAFVYLVSENQSIQPSISTFPVAKDVYFIFPCPPKDEVPANVQYAFSREKISIAALANRVAGIFKKYQVIDRKLTESVLRGDSLQSLVDIAGPLFGNEITIRDANHRYVATSFEQILFYDNDYEDQPDQYGFSSLDEINMLKRDRNYKEQEKTNRPFYYPFREHTLLCLDVFHEDLFLYRIKISDVKRPLRPYDQEMLLYFSTFVLQYHLDHRTKIEWGNKELRRLIISLLEHKNYVDEKEVADILASYGWNVSDQYLVFCMRPGQTLGSMKAYSYYSRYLEQKIKQIITVEWEDSLIIIGNLTRGYEDKEHLLTRIVVEYIRDENYRAGVSDVCNDFLHLYSYYSQAFAALSAGLRCNPSIWTYPFSKYRFHFLREIVTEYVPDPALLMPGMKDLYRSDRVDGTEHIKTLQIYLVCGGNMAKASRQLNIHHSTLSYRLKQICRILSISLEDKDALLWLNLVIRLGLE